MSAQAVDPGDYTVRFEPAEMNRLRTIFPDGVCDWSRPGLGQTGLRGTWQTFNSIMDAPFFSLPDIQVRDSGG